jgi:hypothetical protein
LYGVNGLILDLELEEQFREILFSVDFPCLKSVIFEDVSEFVQEFYTIKCGKAPPSSRGIYKEARVTFQELDSGDELDSMYTDY